MKKLLTITLSILLLLSITACGGDKTYTLKDLALYDTQTDRYIEIGYSLKTVTDMLGEPTSENQAMALYSSKELYYSDYGLTITFDEKDCVEYMKLSTSSNDIDTKRLKLAKKLNISSTVNDFMKIFPDAVNTDGLFGDERKKIAFDAEDKENLTIIDANTDSRTHHLYSVYIDYNDKGIVNIVVGEYGQKHF